MDTARCRLRRLKLPQTASCDIRYSIFKMQGIWLLYRMVHIPYGTIDAKVYIDTNYTARAIIFGYPNIEDVYFMVQAVDKNFNVITTYMSEVYSSIEELQPMLDKLIQIT